MIKQLIAAALFCLVLGCNSSGTHTAVEQPSTLNDSDSALLAEVKAAPEPEAKKVKVFNDVKAVQNKLSEIGLGEMRTWRYDGIGWLSSCDYFQFGHSNGEGLKNNLALYLESPSESFVQVAKLKVNIPNMSEKQQALKTYTKNVEKLFKALALPMPNGLEGALLSGKKFEYHDNKIIVRNIYEDGNWDSYKVQIEAL